MDNTDDQFSLKWNNFQSNLATGFHDLLQEEMMVDVTLAAEGKFLHAHKIILSVCSPYFKDLFKVNPCKHPIVILKDVGHQEMADMLDFMYRGEANVRQEDLAAFLKLAETLKVKGLAGDKSGDDEPPASSQAPKRSSAPQVPKKKKVTETPVFESDDHDPGDTDYNPGGGEPRRKKRRATPPPKTESVMPSSSSSAQPFPLANPKQEMPEPEEIHLIDDNEEVNDPLVQLIAGQGKQETDQQDFDDSNFDNTLEDTGDGTHDTDFDITAGPSNPDETTDQIPQGLGRERESEGTIRRLRAFNPIWNFFKLEENQEIAWCETCLRPLKYRKGMSKTSNLIQHLRLHQVKYQEFLNDKSKRALGLLNANMGDSINFTISRLPSMKPFPPKVPLTL
ncbi:UNVERIFIED_CONTAM: hypothetical protein PYX00_001501 [Menopon gallinae]|uniref:BTB domain-containing protein n=1 Tax=Menopon gallinae TaxID=328185 RepID=A0AAW2IDL4_9NEOP